MSENQLIKMNLSSLEEVQNALSLPFPEHQLKKRQSWSFIPIERIRQRLITVLGIDAFDIRYDEVKHHSEDWITVNCTLTIDFTKWGGRIKQVMQTDGIQIKRHSSGDNKGLIVDLGNDYKTLYSGALAKAAQDLGIGLYIPLNKDNSFNGGGNNNYGGNRGGNNNSNNEYEKVKKTIFACEKTIGINEQTKLKLLKSLFPQANEHNVAKNPTFEQADAYKKIIQPVSFIVQDVRKANINDQEALNILSSHFKRQINSYSGLLTLANQNTVNFFRDWIKQRNRTA